MEIWLFSSAQFTCTLLLDFKSPQWHTRQIPPFKLRKFASSQTLFEELLVELRKNKGMTEEMARKQVNDKLVYAMLMLRSGDADGVVSGAINHTADVLRPAFQIVKVKPGVGKVSSVFIFESPDEEKFGENGFMVFADCGVNPNPTDEDLAEIAILSSETAEKICGMTPRVAMLTYSSKSGDEIYINGEYRGKTPAKFDFELPAYSMLRLKKKGE